MQLATNLIDDLIPLRRGKNPLPADAFSCFQHMTYLEVQGSNVQLAHMQGDSRVTFYNCLQVDRSQSFDIWKTDAHWAARSKDALGTRLRLGRCGAIVGIMLLDLACKLQDT